MNKKNNSVSEQNFKFLENNFKEFISNEKKISKEWIEFLSENIDFSSDQINNSQVSLSEKINLIFPRIIKFYRKFGYLSANLNPLELKKTTKELDEIMGVYLKQFNLSNQDLETKIKNENHIYNGKKLSEVLDFLSKKYLGKTSAEFEHLIDDEKYLWLTNNYEKEFIISNEDKVNIEKDLMEAVGFEKFINAKFQGAKRFSIEGAESAIVFFNKFLKESSFLGVKDIVIGMAHRGRLNFLTKVCGEDYSSILGQFAGKNYLDEDLIASGDVKYHLGSSKTCNFEGGLQTKVSLMPNPSHLEAVNGPVLGRTRAKQDLFENKIEGKKKVIPFLIHGDASFVGQGVVYECLAMNNLEGYDVGGCIHLIIDNQIGFTAEAFETRPSKYASDVAKTLNVPIFHVNADSPEDVFSLAKLCANLRQNFHGDVVVNLVCYRKYGHNEADEPLFTNPVLYKKISSHESVTTLYREKLIAENLGKTEVFEKQEDDFNKFLQNQLDVFIPKNKNDLLHQNWQKHDFVFSDEDLRISLETGLSMEFLKKLLDVLKNSSLSLNINEKLKKLVLDARIKMLESPVESSNFDEKNIDWGMAEMLAFSSILNDGQSVRLSGEDVVRGTFAHRHAAFIDSSTGEKHFYYKELAKNKARFHVYNSLLSEYAVMGFEYGYSTFNENNLVIWEAQFGDFVNCAQVVIDQYISAAEQKWLQTSNLVLMLPHGYEGQGPEHSSARIERFLQLSSQFNMRIVHPTTPANLFHILRAQVAEKTVKKPLIIFTPKSLLRHKLVKSSLSEMIFESGDVSSENSGFQSILFDQKILSDSSSLKKIKKIILCSGKIFYELFERIAFEKKEEEIFLIRIECLYPFPAAELMKVFNIFYNSALVDSSKVFQDLKLIWAQDEPKNMGAYRHVLNHLSDLFAHSSNKILAEKNVFKDLIYIGRKASASTANGSQYVHAKEQKEIIDSCMS